MVLLGEYRGTQVAVKRVLPRSKKSKNGKFDPMTSGNPGMRSSTTGSTSVSMSMSKGLRSSKNHMSGIHGSTRAGESTSRKKMRKEFLEEMRYLSKLRHRESGSEACRLFPFIFIAQSLTQIIPFLHQQLVSPRLWGRLSVKIPC